jgi:hypothetical protein
MLKERRFECKTHAGIVTVLNAPVAQRIFIHRKWLVATGIEVERFKNRTDGTDIETLLIWIARELVCTINNSMQHGWEQNKKNPVNIEK